MAAGKKKTHEEYVLELAEKNPTIEVMGTYINNATLITHRCKICNYIWQARPCNTLRERACPVCAFPAKVIGPAPEYRNSIWASKYRKLAEYYGFSEDLMKSTRPMSSKKITIVCPDCGCNKAISPAELLTQGLFCNHCNDGISYPEKFIAAVLTQLDITFEARYSFDWSSRKQYDFYLPEYSCIIEAHGAQHYEDSRLSGPAERQKENDSYKEHLARTNGILYYFQVDCRESEPEWISQNLYKSGFFDLLNISDSKFDWEKCAIEALHSKIKQAAKYWNTGHRIDQISALLGVNRITIRRWLKKATQAGLCNYNTQVSWDRGHDEDWKASHHKAMTLRRKQVMCIETGICYESYAKAGQQLDLCAANIGRSARNGGKYAVGGLHFVEIC